MPEHNETPAPQDGVEGVPGEAGQPAVPHDSESPGEPQRILRNFAPGELGPAELERSTELSLSAIGYFRRFGWLPIPVHWIEADGACSCHRPQCAQPGKHPILNGWQNLRPDESQIIAWWSISGEYPLANIGILTGAPSGILPLDVDPDHGGAESLAALEAQHGELPFTRMHHSGGGGPHYFFAMPQGMDAGNAHGKLGKGLDIKGTGGYIIVSPSISGKGPYEGPPNEARDIEPAEMPPWMIEWLTERQKLQRGEPSAAEESVAPTGLRQAYARAVLAARTKELREAGPGTRNDTLNACAFALGQLGPDGIVEQETAWAALSEAASACGLSAGETRATFLSGWGNGYLSPFHPDWKELDQEWPLRRWNQVGLGHRMVDHWADVLRWSPDIPGRWMAYRANTWQPAGEKAGLWYAQKMIVSLRDTEALGYDDQRGMEGESEAESPREKFIEWAWKQEKTESFAAAAEVCLVNDQMRIRQRDCDANPYLINLRNGVWDARAALNRGRLVPHDQNFLLTMQCAVTYNADAACPGWDDFLEEMQPDPEMRAFIYRMMGYSMTGDTSEQCIFLHHGDGMNGKSVFNYVMKSILGGYAQTVPVDTLLVSRSDGNVPNDVARMSGKRYLTASETKAGKQLDEQQIKELTGGELVAARFMRAEFFEFKPTGKIHLTSNHLVHISDDPATRRRLFYVPWREKVAEGQQDKHLPEKLFEREAPGILNRLLGGLTDWLDRGELAPPSASLNAKQQHHEEEDTLGQFVDEWLIITDKPEVGDPLRSTSYLYSCYASWSRQGGMTPMAVNSFSVKLAKRYERVRTGIWRGFPHLQPRFTLDGPPA